MKTKTVLYEAHKALQDGDRAGTRKLLEALVQAEPDNADAWLLLFTTLDNPLEKLDALKQAQRIRPEDEAIREKVHHYKASAEYRAIKAGRYIAKKEADEKARSVRKREEVAASRRSFFQEAFTSVRRFFASARNYLRDRF